MKRCLFLVNPVSGKRTIQGGIIDVLSVFTQADIASTVILTQYAGHATEYVQAHAGAYDMVACAGGDGTLNECITGLLRGGHSIPLGYLPCGSTNDFAESHGIPTNPVLAAKRLVEGTPSPIDIGEINGRYFTYIASFGAFTAASYAAPQKLKNAIGHTAYMVEVVRELPTAIRPIRAVVTAGRRRFRGAFVFGAVSNTKSMGGIVKLKDDMVNHADGLFELTLMRYPRCINDYYTILKNVFTFNFTDKRLRFLHTKGVHMEFENPVDFTLDGEKLADVREATVSIHKGAIALYK